jgi:hypothetical protein
MKHALFGTRSRYFVMWLNLLWAAGPTLNASDLTSKTDLNARLERLEAEVQAAEDVSAIKRLQRAYSYYVDKGMWEDLSSFFTEDAIGNYPAGIFIGRESLRRHLFMNVGGVKLGEVGLGDNRLYNHMNIQPVVHLDPGGQTAKGRWRAFVTMGRYGANASWAEGIYEVTYAKENGVWKIKRLDYYSGFSATYDKGWVAPETPRAATGGDSRRKLAHPADRERKMECEGFPAACIAPFHYENPAKSAAARVWTTSQPAGATPRSGDAGKRAAELVHRVKLLRDEQQIENLQRIYGYYFDRAMWDQMADLFADSATIELGLRGVYVGKKRVREFLNLLGPHGLRQGWLNDHIQLQTIVTVADDGNTARARSRELEMSGIYGANARWSEGVYENAYVKEKGIWKFKSVRFYPTFICDYGLGWAKDAQPAPGMSAELPPDRPPTDVYEIYPKAHVPPFHYRNPVTGKAPRYPAAGGPSERAAAAALAPITKAPLHTPKNIEAALAEVAKQIERVRDFHELENLEGAYGYYLDKNLWNQIADLFARDGSMELAQRGIYKSQPHVRAFLLQVFGRGQEGPIAGRLGNHIQMQPVIHISDDGTSAKIRVRLLQQMSTGSRASVSGAIYENEAVKENGVWQLSKLHAYNTFSASYEGGWAKNATRSAPGPSSEIPADAPPTLQFEMFPTVYDIPFHYANPVTGRTELAPVSKDSFPSPPAAKQ